MLFFEVKTCHDWNVLPSEMGICEPEYDLTLMSAYISAVGDMQAYEKAEDEKKAELNRRSSAKPSVPHAGGHIPRMRG